MSLWKTVLSVSVLISLQSSFTTSSMLPQIEPMDSRLIGGTHASLQDFSYLVSIRLQVLEVGRFGNGHLCSSVLISRQDVLTGAKCVLNGSGPRDSKELIVISGITQLGNNTGAVQSLIATIWLQEDQNLAIIRLQTPIEGSTIVILNEFHQQNDKRCMVVGWSSNSTEESVVQKNLREFYVRLDRSTNVLDIFYITLEEPHFGICFEDMGVPLLCDGSLIGILTRRPPRCESAKVEFLMAQNR
ncbi:testisin-like [Uranotaenia lowii]|uniref:testisin-like n=1 Tax=Uranotaenia lowii TaxID=190385 RepID=UPI00247B1B4D|nr:testisin-like [Uranotaenia lowii]